MYATEQPQKGGGVIPVTAIHPWSETKNVVCLYVDSKECISELGRWPKKHETRNPIDKDAVQTSARYKTQLFVISDSALL